MPTNKVTMTEPEQKKISAEQLPSNPEESDERPEEYSLCEESSQVETTIEGVYNTLTKFSGDDKTYAASKWAQDIEDNAEIFRWSKQQQLIVARRTLSGTAELWMRSEKTFRTFAELKTAILKEFPSAVNPKEMHEIMTARKKLKNESYYQYMLTMKELGKRAKIADYVAIQYIVDGIEDNENSKALLYGVTTYTALKEKLHIYERMKERSAAKTKSPFQDVKTQRATTSPSRRCYNCGGMGHLASACRNGLKCFRCNQNGHFGHQCTATTNSKGTYAGKFKNASGLSTNREAVSAKQSSAMFGMLPKEYQCSCSCGGATVAIEPDNDSEVSDGHEVMQIVNNSVLCVKKGSKKAMKVVKINEISVNALVDTGSDVNLISLALFTSLKTEKMNDDLVLSGLGQSKVLSTGRITADIRVDELCYKNVCFHVVPENVMPYELIIGQELLGYVTMIMNEGVVKFLPPGCDWVGKMYYFAGCTNIVTDHITNSMVKEEVMRCIKHYKPVQTEEAPILLKIFLKDDMPVSQRPRRLSIAEQQVVERQVDEWLQNGIIQVSYSEYSSPLVLVKKKDGAIRVCVDYRLLNRKIVKDEFPLPVIDDLIDKLRGARVFSVLDLKNGFFHLKVSDESIKYTSFVTHHGQFEFLRAPFGLSTSPKMFMRFVTIIFRDLISQGILMIFIDDILIPAQDEIEALQRLKQVLEVSSRFGLEINWKKAHLIQREILYLGHVIKEGEVRPSTEKTDVVARYPEPRNIKQLHSFVGLTGYFRKYIEDYAMIAKPLTDLLKKNEEFSFGAEQRTAFKTLKQKLISGPVLKIFDIRLRTEMHTDASCLAYSAILMQYHPNSGLHPVYYMSRKTNDAQSRYTSYELEALAIIEGVKKFRHYLYGIHFKIVTDCKAFELTLKKKDLTPKVARWVLLLDEYDYEIEHRVGTKMRHTDALSRIPFVATVSTLNEEIRSAQNDDEGLKAIKEILKKNPYNDYWVDNGLLFKGEQKQLVVPKSLEKEIMKRVHSNGHFAKIKMKELLARDYYIRDIDKKIEEFLRSCIPCLMAMRKEGKQEGWLNPIEKESIPFDTLHIDHIGPLTETKKLYNYILTVIDSFTKFVWLFPTKSTSSKETLNKLRIHQQIFGNPRRIVSDRGTAFTSNEFEDYCKEENIQHVRITTGLPRGNGQVERVHRVLIPALTKLCIENPTLWYRHVSRVQRALNSTFHRSIHTTPFELLMGAKMRNKEDIEIVELLEEEIISQYDENREIIREQAKEHILKIQEENRRGFNKKRKKSFEYMEGDLVAIKRTQFGPGLKLKPKYLGPYKVTKCKRNDRYDVEKDDPSAEGPIKTSSSADQMKKWPELGELSE